MDARPRRARGGHRSDALLPAAGLTLRPRLSGVNGRIARFADGSTLEVGVVVWATGYRSDSG